MADEEVDVVAALKADMTDAEVRERFDKHVAIGRRGWADPVLQAALERVQEMLAAQPSAEPGLEVERLAFAISEWEDGDTRRPSAKLMERLRRDAEQLAAIYDRLALASPAPDADSNTLAEARDEAAYWRRQAIGAEPGEATWQEPDHGRGSE